MGVWKGMVVTSKRQLSESVQIVESEKTSVLSFLNMAEYSQSRGNLNRCDGPFPSNEHGNLYFLLHKIIVHIIILNLEKKIKFVRRKKRYSRKPAQNRYSNMQIMTMKTTTLWMLYVHVVLNCVICPPILYDIVLYAPHFLPVKPFTKCYLSSYCKI